MVAIAHGGTTLDLTGVPQASGTSGQTKTVFGGTHECGRLDRDVEEDEMKRRTTSISILAAGLLALCLPALAAAQGGYGYPDYGRQNGTYGRYDQRYVRDSIHRLDRLAKDFERDLSRALDRSRINGSRNEDYLNAQARDFRRAVGDLKSRFGNGNDLNRSRNEAQRVMQEAQQFNQLGRSRAIDNRVASDWSQIQQELRIISDAYGIGFYNGGWGSGRNNRNNQNRNNDWWRRIPWPN